MKKLIVPMLFIVSLTSCAIFERPPEVIVEAFRLNPAKAQALANEYCMEEHSLPLATFKDFVMGGWSFLEPASLYVCSDPNASKK